MDGMEVLDSDIKDKVRAAMQSYDYNAYTDADVRAALANAKQGHCGIEDFKALLSPAALPHLEEMAVLAQKERLAHFGDCVYIFTPLYIADRREPCRKRREIHRGSVQAGAEIFPEYRSGDLPGQYRRIPLSA